MDTTFREALQAKGIEPCIPSSRSRKVPYPYDKALYKQRHTVENLFAKLKDWRRIATRYDRCARLLLKHMHRSSRHLPALILMSPEPKSLKLLAARTAKLRRCNDLAGSWATSGWKLSVSTELIRNNVLKNIDNLRYSGRTLFRMGFLVAEAVRSELFSEAGFPDNGRFTGIPLFLAPIHTNPAGVSYIQSDIYEKFP